MNPCLSNRTKDKKIWTESGILGRFARLKNNSCEVEIVKALSSRSVLPIFPVTFCIKNIKFIESNWFVLSKEIISTLFWKVCSFYSHQHSECMESLNSYVLLFLQSLIGNYNENSFFPSDSRILRNTLKLSVLSWATARSWHVSLVWCISH